MRVHPPIPPIFISLANWAFNLNDSGSSYESTCWPEYKKGVDEHSSHLRVQPPAPSNSVADTRFNAPESTIASKSTCPFAVDPSAFFIVTGDPLDPPVLPVFGAVPAGWPLLVAGWPLLVVGWPLLAVGWPLLVLSVPEEAPGTVGVCLETKVLADDSCKSITRSSINFVEIFSN